MSDLAETIALLRKLYASGRSGNVDDICRMEREIWKVLPALLDAAEAGMRARDAALDEAAVIAENACLVPPDGGAPTDAERELCEEAARLIRSLKGAA